MVTWLMYSRELAGHRIRVNGIAPGLVATAMTGAVPAKDALSSLATCAYITGANIDMNGGYLNC